MTHLVEVYTRSPRCDLLPTQRRPFKYRATVVAVSARAAALAYARDHSIDPHNVTAVRILADKA